MVGKIVISFVALVGLMYVLNYPDQALGLLEVVVESARRMAEGLSQLDLQSGKKQ